ncbi:MAG: nucleotidyltransferase family protein [Clostridia bacterium]|nr:nucleotidyltransferase family protein [Clostridia bacterium]
MMPTLSVKKNGLATPAWLLSLRRFWLSPIFFALLLLACCTFTALSREVAGAMTLLWLILIILVTSDDAFAATVPFLLLTVLVSACYDGYALFIPYLPMVAPALAALLFHFIYYRAQYRIGYSFAPLIAVSVAVTLGGVGCLTLKEYFTPATLYYVAGLGFGMVGVYLLLKSALSRKRDYDVKKLLLTGLYLVGLYATFFTLLFYAERLVWMQDDLEIFGHLRLISIDNRNVYATFLLLALPAPFYHAARGKGWHLIPALAFLAALLMTGSRGGMLMGLALFGLCFLYLLRHDKKHRRRNIIILALLALAALSAGGFLIKFYSFRFEGGFIKGDEPRVRLLGRAVEDFLYHPIFGVGLGYTGNADIYDPKAFAMNWYHMMIPQIVAGMGLVGTFAYAFLFWRRGVLIRRNADPLSRALALSYIGLFLMSQVNPGEFCPMPYELIAVMIFLFLEENGEHAVKAQQKTTETALTSLISHALFKTPLDLPPDTDLDAVLALADRHMVFGIVGEALGTLPEDALTQDALLCLQDKTVTLLRQNARLAACRAALCAFLKEQGIPAVILKGDSVARLYPSPDLRVAGDIDCLVDEAALPTVGAYLISQGFTAHETHSEHHAVYKKNGCEIELHRTVSGLPEGEVRQKLCTYLDNTLAASTLAEMNGEHFPVASDFHQALILLLHMQQHMREGGLGLRQMCDWALFVAKDLKKETVPRLIAALHEVGLYRFAAATTLAAVRHLGLPAEKCPFEEGDTALADALFADFMASGNFGLGNADFAGSGIVTLHRQEGKGSLATALANVKKKCREEWPLCQKHGALLLFLVPFWVVRRLLKAPVRPLSMLRSAGARGSLYDSLKLFEEDERS